MPAAVFVAVVPPSRALAELASVVAELRSAAPELAWVHPARWHVTIAYLGPLPAVPEELLDPVAAGQISLHVSGAGCFPDVRRARVLWAGLDGGVSALADVAELVRSRCRAAHLPVEASEFRPHVTLARTRGRPPDLFPLVSLLAGVTGTGFVVSELAVLRSTPGPQPYDLLHRISLREQPPA